MVLLHCSVCENFQDSKFKKKCRHYGGNTRPNVCFKNDQEEICCPWCGADGWRGNGTCRRCGH